MGEAAPRIEHLLPARQRIAAVADVARRHAVEVDRDNRFPHEAMRALKDARLLGTMIPREFGGESTGLADVADICATLAQACGSTAMIFAMHQIKASSLIDHSDGSVWHQTFMRRCADEQLLLGSATTEGGGIGGDLRNSICAMEIEGERFRLDKEASVISYATESDAILVTARRHKDAPGSDQSMAVVTKDQYTLTKTAPWDTLGMRGTCSEGFRLVAEAPVEQIFTQPFAEIAGESMLAMAHLLWGATWFGLAADAVGKAQAVVRTEARRRPDVTPPMALRLAETIAELQTLKSVVMAGIARYEAAGIERDVLGSIGFGVAMNNIKVIASEKSADIIRKALLITGIAGYRNDSPHSVGRNMRDALSAAIMISNERILGNTAPLLLIGKYDTSLVA